MASLNFTFVYQNLPLERILSEVNARVKYSIKKVVVEMNMETDTYFDVHKFCVSAVSCLVAEFGLNKVVQTWSFHSISSIHVFDQEKKCCFTKGKQKFENQICI